VTACLYAPHVRSAAFVYEDLNDLNTTYRAWQGWRIELHDAAVRPARALTRLVDRSVGFSPVRQHAASLALHLAAGALVYALGLTVIAPRGAVLAAALFLLAPWQVEAVAYAAARADVLMTLAVLWGALAIERGRFGWAWLAAVAAVAAKESGVAAWLLLPAWAWWIDEPWPLGWLLVWCLTALGGVLVGLAAHVGTLTAPPVLTGLRDLAGLLLTPPWRLSIDPETTSWGPLVLLSSLVGIGLARAPRWTALVVGGVLLAWLPRLLVPLSEAPHFHHLMLPTVFLSLGVAKWVTFSEDGGVDF
jgi:hypothetical protein